MENISDITHSGATNGKITWKLKRKLIGPEDEADIIRPKFCGF